MNEHDQANSRGRERGDVSGQYPVQSEEKGSKHFFRNGFEVFSFGSQEIVSWGFLAGLAGLIFATLTVYIRFGAQVDERVTKHPDVIEMKINLKNTKEQVDKVESKQESIICQMNKGKNCK